MGFELTTVLLYLNCFLLFAAVLSLAKDILDFCGEGSCFELNFEVLYVLTNFYIGTFYFCLWISFVRLLILSSSLSVLFLSLLFIVILLFLFFYRFI